MEVKLYPRPSKDGKEIIYADYIDDAGKRVRKSLNLKYTKSNIAYVKKNIIPKIEQKIRYGLSAREYLVKEFTDRVLAKVKESLKKNTYMTYDSAVKRFLDYFGNINIEKINVFMIEDYIALLKKEGLSSSSISVYLVPIQLAFKMAIRMRIVDINPAQLAFKPTVKNKEKKVFNLVQMHQLLEKAEGELKTFLYFAFFTGARPGEIISLRWSDIKNNMINIQRTKIKDGSENSPKGGKSRKIALLKPLEDYLRNLTKSGDKIFSRSYATFLLHFSALQKSMRYERQTLHVTRHTFASLLMQAKESPTLIQYFLGHVDLNMINKVYAHYIEDEKDVGRIADFLAQS